LPEVLADRSKEDLRMETRKIVINCDYGGFGLSEEAKLLYEKQSGEQKEDFFDFDLRRDDPVLIRIVEELGDKASDSSACLKVVEIPPPTLSGESTTMMVRSGLLNSTERGGS